VVTRQRPRSTRLLVVALVSISLAVITLDYRQGASGPLAGVGTAAKSVMAPMQRAVTTVIEPVGDFFSGLAHLPSLADENERLQEENDALRTQIASDAYEQEQYRGLLDLMELRGSLDPTSVPALVIANGISNFEYTITIDKGSNAGIEVDQPVATGFPGSPMLVGRVVQVTPTSSDVRLSAFAKNGIIAAKMMAAMTMVTSSSTMLKPRAARGRGSPNVAVVRRLCGERIRKAPSLVIPVSRKFTRLVFLFTVIISLS